MESNIKIFPEMNIFTVFPLKNYLDEKIENPQVFIIGKFNEHNCQGKYSFQACEFQIYLPFNNKTFTSSMSSEECFTNSLKWNYNFFKKIRYCFMDPESIKHSYFSISYEKKETELKKSNSKIDIVLNKPNTDDDDDLLEIFDFNEKKFFFEIHFIVEDKDITAFRLFLKPSIEEKPYLSICKKLIEMDKIEEDNLIHKQSMLNVKEKDLAEMENKIKDIEDQYNDRKMQYIAKFNLLINEKDKKIKSLKSL